MVLTCFTIFKVPVERRISGPAAYRSALCLDAGTFPGILSQVWLAGMAIHRNRMYQDPIRDLGGMSWPNIRANPGHSAI